MPQSDTTSKANSLFTNYDELDSAFLKTVVLLYVEDDNDVREQLARFLSYRVGTLITATNGAEGLEAFREHRPKIVITDIQMPVMDGLNMAMAIRELDGSVPIIVTTAFEQIDYLMRSIDIGVDKYVTKPVDIERLSEALLTSARYLRAEELLRRQRELAIAALRTRHFEALGIMAGGMAHDYNNLLQVIIGYISLAQMNAEPGSEMQAILNNVVTSSTQAIGLGQNLRILANGNDAHFLVSPLPLLIATVVNAALDKSGVKAEFHLPDDLPLVRFDEAQIKQALTFLAVNVKEAMPAGGTLLVTACTTLVSDNNLLSLEAGNYLHINFQDTGPGITPENLSQIFDPYFTTKEMGSQKGMGLSLALCRAIIWKHGGMITAESNLGEGAKFQIYLPVAPIG